MKLFIKREIFSLLDFRIMCNLNLVDASRAIWKKCPKNVGQGFRAVTGSV